MLRRVRWKHQETCARSCTYAAVHKALSGAPELEACFAFLFSPLMLPFSKQCPFYFRGLWMWLSCLQAEARSEAQFASGGKGGLGRSRAGDDDDDDDVGQVFVVVCVCVCLLLPVTRGASRQLCPHIFYFLFLCPSLVHWFALRIPGHTSMNHTSASMPSCWTINTASAWSRGWPFRVRRSFQTP